MAPQKNDSNDWLITNLQTQIRSNKTRGKKPRDLTEDELCEKEIQLKEALA